MSQPSRNAVSTAASAAAFAGVAIFYALKLRREVKEATKKGEHDKRNDGEGPDLSWQERSGGATRSRFRAKQTCVRVVCAPTASEYGKCIDHCVSKDDSVLIICGTAGGTKSSDGGATFAAEACGAEPCVYRGDVWDVPALQSSIESSARGPDVTAICLDATNIFGNDIFMDTAALVKLYTSVFGSSLRTILIKSRLVARHARSFHTFESFVNNGGMEGVAKDYSSGTGGGCNEVQVVCAVGVNHYRKTIPLVVKEGDHLLEIGCHFGKTTFLMAEAAAEGKTEIMIDNARPSKSYVAGVDIGKKIIDRAKEENRKLQERKHSLKERHYQCHFEVADAWDTKHLLSLSRSFNAIYIDVGGISGADGIFEGLTLIRQIVSAYSSSVRCIVVKSRCLRDHALMWQHADKVLNR